MPCRSQPSEPKAPRDSTLSKTFQIAEYQFDWLRKFEDRSVTELEVRHAVLNDPQSPTASRALFFLKGNQRSAHMDDDKRLTQLKNELLTNTGLRIRNYTDVEAMGEELYQVLSYLLPITYLSLSLTSFDSYSSSPSCFPRS